MNNFEEILARILLEASNKERGKALDDSGEGLDVFTANYEARKERKESDKKNAEMKKNLANFIKRRDK